MSDPVISKPKLLTAREARVLARCSRTKIYRALNSGELPNTKITSENGRTVTHVIKRKCLLRWASNIRRRNCGKPRTGAKWYTRKRLSDGTSVYEHRWIMENRLGRKLGRHEQVHHIDGDRGNNALDNLVVLTESEHHRLHAQEMRDYD